MKQMGRVVGMAGLLMAGWVAGSASCKSAKADAPVTATDACVEKPPLPGDTGNYHVAIHAYPGLTVAELAGVTAVGLLDTPFVAYDKSSKYTAKQVTVYLRDGEAIVSCDDFAGSKVIFSLPQ